MAHIPNQNEVFPAPDLRLLPRLFLIGFVGFCLGLPGMAILSDLPEIKLHERVPSSMPGEPELVAPEGSNAWEKAVYLAENFPAVCRSHQEVNDLQRARCDKLWLKAVVFFGLATFPFLLGLVAAFIARDHIRFFYRATRQRIRRFPPETKGLVLRHAWTPDLFAWIYCLRKVIVELPDGQRKEVYVPLSDAAPRSPEILTLFDAGRSFGKKRWVGVLYAPHMAIRSGSR